MRGRQKKVEKVNGIVVGLHCNSKEIEEGRRELFNKITVDIFNSIIHDPHVDYERARKRKYWRGIL